MVKYKLRDIKQQKKRRQTVKLWLEFERGGNVLLRGSDGDRIATILCLDVEGKVYRFSQELKLEGIKYKDDMIEEV